MQYVKERPEQIIKKNDVFDVSTLLEKVLKPLDERMKQHGIELRVTETLEGDMLLDVVKKKITRTRKHKVSGRDLLNAV
jgi:hypothetical protein